MSKEEIVEEFIKWFENYGIIIPDGSSATIKDFMVDSEIQLMAEELYEDFFVDLQSQLSITEKALELACDNLYDINFQLYNTEMNFVDYFKQQAEKEMMKSE